MAESLIALLRWYAEMGVDIALDEIPHDRTAAPAQPDRAPPAIAIEEPPQPPAARPPVTVAGAETVERDARAAAAASKTLEELRAELLAFEGCGLKTTATQLVFGDGEAGAKIMFVGEAPGADEDRQGVPFVGRAGQLLNRMLAAIGLDRRDVYISNVVPWRPPGNRTPTMIETAACLPFTRRQIELVGPKILVCLGLPSAQTLLGAKDSMTRIRGRWLTYDCGGTPIRAIALFHPAYLLRQPGQKKLAWQDLRMLARALEQMRAGEPATSGEGV
ncbi:uracil-DNA glycosylase [Methylocella silvestris]|uniref:Type-4 uracil-DNA glycosylase n=1 Tax=Methylocella silvestris TaxID=199596 RepID=A0A2J7TH55_METSI|nr:uracil-DNA glycosylase [Methylocella silvestris]PNG26086.1 uracil-DNA glycosylase [Methylocella silvestris]